MMDWLVQHGPLVATLCFFVGFVGIALWAYLPRNRERMNQYGQIPFKERDNG